MAQQPRYKAGYINERHVYGPVVSCLKKIPTRFPIASLQMGQNTRGESLGRRGTSRLGMWWYDRQAQLEDLLSSTNLVSGVGVAATGSMGVTTAAPVPSLCGTNNGRSASAVWDKLRGGLAAIVGRPSEAVQCPLLR